MYKTILVCILMLSLVIPGVIFAQDTPDKANHTVPLRWYVDLVGADEIIEHRTLGEAEAIVWNIEVEGALLACTLIRTYDKEKNTHAYRLGVQVFHPKKHSDLQVVDLVDVPPNASASSVIGSLFKLIQEAFEKAVWLDVPPAK